MFDLLQRLLIPLAAGTALAAVLALLRPLTRRRFSAGWHYYMWLAPLAVMLIPLRIRLPRPVLPLEETVGAVFRLPLVPTVEAAPAGVPTAPVLRSGATWGELAAALWLVMAGALFIWKAVRYFLWRQRLMKHSRPAPCPGLVAFTRRSVGVRTGGVASPLLLGLFRPTLFLPDTPLTDRQLDHVLAHETVHLRRGDLWIKWFVMLLRCLYWFNPAVHLIGRQMERDCELSCDRAVVKNMEPEQIRGYLDTLLLLAAGRTAPPAAALGGSGRLLKKRFRMAMENRRISRRAGWASALLACVLIAGTVAVSGVAAGDRLPPVKAGSSAKTGTDGETLPPRQAADMLSAGGRSAFTDPCPGRDRISARYGYRWGSRHPGVDYAAPVGTPAVAAADGVVIAAASAFREPVEGIWPSEEDKLGLYLLIDHGRDGTGRQVTSLYAHLDNLAVGPGDLVTAGQVIGSVGMTGNAAGPHLHFEIRVDGYPVDPILNYIADGS